MSREEHLSTVAEWEEGTCQDCGCPFPQRHHYERRCPLCYKENKGYNVLWGDQAFLWTQAKLDETRSQLQEAQRKLEAKKETSAAGPQSGLRGDLLRQVISLCHPDKHAGSKKATEVTMKLLALRNAGKRRKKK